MADDHEPDEEEQGEDDVGYRQPPFRTRWKKGESGNILGRPRGAKGHKAIIKRVAHEVRSYSEGDRTKRANILELVLLKVRNTAAQGDLRALSLFGVLSGYDQVDDPQVPKGAIFLPEKLTAEEFQAKYAKRSDRYDGD